MSESNNNETVATTPEVIDPSEVTLYQLPDFHPEVSPQLVKFYKLNADGTFEDGTTLEAMLTVCIHRLKSLNAKFSCEENEHAITDMQSALEWLNKRTADRQARGVEGKHEA